MLKFHLVLSAILLISVWSCKNQSTNYQSDDLEEEISEEEDDDFLFNDVDSLSVFIDSAMSSMDNKEINEAYNFLMLASQNLKQENTFESNNNKLAIIEAATDLQRIANDVKEKKIVNSKELGQALSKIEYLYGTDDEESEMDEDGSNEDND